MICVLVCVIIQFHHLRLVLCNQLFSLSSVYYSFSFPNFFSYISMFPFHILFALPDFNYALVCTYIILIPQWICSLVQNLFKIVLYLELYYLECSYLSD